MPDERQRSLPGLLVDLLLLATLSFLLDACHPEIIDLLRPALGLVPAMALHLAAMLALVLLGLLLTLRLWHHPARHRARAGGGLLLLLATGFLVYAGANAGVHMLVARDLHAIRLALDGFADAKLLPLPDGTIRITGPLGPNLMRDFRAAEAASGPSRASRSPARAVSSHLPSSSRISSSGTG
ncbi:MAG: hypothetical protein R3D25_16265 [Geminicoccaceae bacterium]